MAPTIAKARTTGLAADRAGYEEHLPGPNSVPRSPSSRTGDWQPAGVLAHLGTLFWGAQAVWSITST
jgi:hypothetical protein